MPAGDDKNTSRHRKCGGDDGHKSPHGAPESPTATATPDNWGSGGGGGGTQMGLRVEEKSRGLTVTHVVPGVFSSLGSFHSLECLRLETVCKIKGMPDGNVHNESGVACEIKSEICWNNASC